MGLDFIRKDTGSWRKKWKDGRDYFKHPDLFDLNFSQVATSATACMKPQCGAKIGDTYIVEQHGNRLLLSKGLLQVGEIQTPSPAVIYAVGMCGGIATGQVNALGASGVEAQLSIK